MRVAILQNQLSVDGRSHVVGEIAQLLNDCGITPDVFTLASDANIERWRTGQSGAAPIECNVVRLVTVPFFGGYVYQTVFHNWISRRRLRGYDLVVNSNDFLGFVPEAVRRVHYIHFPLSQVFDQAERYRQLRWKLAGLPVRVVTHLLEGRVLPGDIVCSNSAYSAEWIRREWPGSQVVVLPPPVEMPDAPAGPEGRDIDVLSVGAITPDKNQLAQVGIAGRFPDRTFVIMGYVSSTRYHEAVLAAIRERSLTNVRVITDASRDTILAHLRRARVFLHAKRDEHFGISIAEAVAWGCIPVVHDSGGQREIVTDAALRYRTDDEAVEIMTRILAPDGYPADRLAALHAHVRAYSAVSFRRRFATLLRSRGVPLPAGRHE